MAIRPAQNCDDYNDGDDTGMYGALLLNAERDTLLRIGFLVRMLNENKIG